MPARVGVSVEAGPVRDPYDRLIGDALRGDPSLFARQDGVMEAWRVVDPILTEHPPVQTYPRGSWGPDGADSLLGRLGLVDGRDVYMRDRG